MEKENKLALLRIIIAALLLAAAWAADRALALPLWASLLLYLPAYLTVGWDVLLEAGESLVRFRMFNEDLLMSIATLGALAIGFLPGAEPEFPEAVFVMLFFKVGELFEDMAEDNSRRSISQLMDIRPDWAQVEREGQVLSLAPEEVAVGEVIIIKPGERIPLDGTVIEGLSSLNTVALTGESAPRKAAPGDSVLSGCVNISGLLRVRVSKVFGESTVARILDLVENAGEHKSRSEGFITRFARWYTPAVVIAALLLAFLPPLLAADMSGSGALWLKRGLTFLVASCPCALVISVPLTFFSGIGGASKKGILVKGANYLETLAKTGVVVFDKTGTLTKGVFEVSAIHPESCDERELLHLAAHVERWSTHPIALSLRQAYPQEADGCQVSQAEEIAGQGIRALVNGQWVSVGNARMMEAIGVAWKPCEHTGTVIHVAIENSYAGHVVISDQLKEDAAEAVRAIRAAGVGRLVMLSGDQEEAAAQVAGALGLDEYHSQLLPTDKVEKLEVLLAAKAPRRALAFVGDGINDAPVLARADIGIAMGALGSDAAIEAADVVLMDDQPIKIARAIALARKTLAIARQNIVFALIVKGVVLALSGLGIASMGLAVFADVGVMVLAVLNATRALR